MPNNSAATTDDDTNNGQPGKSSVGAPNALELVHHMLQQFVSLKSPAEYIAVALWVLHTFVFDQFLISPRLALISPVRGCGKTTLLATLERLTAKSTRTDGVSPAAIYHLIDDAQYSTLLIDEADNADLGRNGLLRAVLNSGHRKGGSITRLIRGEPKRYSTFSPIAIAAIGALPLPIMARSIVINMQRSDRAKTLRRLDDANATVDLDLAYRYCFMWARKVQFDPNPELPAKLRNRAADNWRPLIAIGDIFGPHWSAAARNAAIILLDGNSDEDIGVTLLADIRDIFDDAGGDRVPSAELIRHLIDREDGSWGEFRGLHGDHSPRALSTGQLAVVLKPFDIRPRSIWPPGSRERSKSRKGYLRSQFESAWARYCPKDGTPAQASNIRQLRRTNRHAEPAHSRAGCL